MMLDADVVAVGPTSVWRVLHNAGLLNSWNGKESKKGTGFVQPLAPHEHWHIDVSYINICGTFYYLCGVLDGCSGIRRARSQTGGRARTAQTAPPGCKKGGAGALRTNFWRITGCYGKLTPPGETEVGSAGEQPIKGYPGAAHQDDAPRSGVRN